MVKLVEQSCEKLSVRCMKKWLVFHSFQKVYEEAGIEIDPKRTCYLEHCDSQEGKARGMSLIRQY